MSSSLSTDAYVAFVDTLTSVRRELGITQRDLASRLGKPQSYVSKSERRERRIDVVEFISWCGALGLDPQEVLGRIRKAASSVGDSR